MSDKDLLATSPDAYTRYKIVFDILKQFLPEGSSVLDVGGQDTLLPKLSAAEKFSFNLTVLDIRSKYPDQKGFAYIQGDITKEIPKTKYDAVVSLDVLEHISDDKKEIFLKNCIELSKQITIIAAPFASEIVDKAEHLANDFYKQNTNENHPWLAEHFENNKPKVSFVENYLKKNNLDYLTFDSNAIQNWLLNMLSNFMLAGLAINKKNIDYINQFFNENFYSLGDFSSPGYRKFFIISENNTLIYRIEKFIQGKTSHNNEVNLDYLNNLISSHRNQTSDLLTFNQELCSKNQELSSKNQELSSKNQELSAEIKNLTMILENIKKARFFKLWQAVSKIKRLAVSIYRNPKKIIKIPKIVINEGMGGLIARLKGTEQSESVQDKLNREYQQWYKKHYPTIEQLSIQTEESKKFRFKPLISLIIPTYNTDHSFLRECIASVQNQSYSNWELCIADDNSKDPEVRNIIKEYAYKDNRIKYVFRKSNGHICKASNSALKLATGEFIGLLDHDDVLWPNALFEVVKVINSNKHVQFIYSDEDKISEDGKTHCDPFFKPDWSPHFLRSTNYITHFSVIKKDLIQKIGGFRPGFEGAQDWDLFLRVSWELEKTGHAHPMDDKNPIQHTPTVLYSWRKSPTSTASENYAAMAKSYAFVNQKKVLEADLDNRDLRGKVLETNYLGLWEVEYEIIGNPLVSIIIPTKDHYEHISKCLDSVLKKTTYQNYEIVIVDTGSTDKQVLYLYKKLIKNPHIRIIYWKKPFNFSAVCNFGAKKAKGDYFLFLNNDTEVIEPRWIEKMLSYAQRDEVGTVGCKLLYPDNRIQHAGVVLGVRGGNIDKGIAGHAFKMFKNGIDYGIFNTMIYGIRDYSAVTAASVMISKDKFFKINGFAESFRIAFNDVDMNLELLKAGYYNVYHPNALLFHHESVSVGDPSKGTRNLEEFSKEINMMHEKWGDLLQNDPFYNKNYSLNHENFSIDN